jgi:hypothetical protein
MIAGVSVRAEASFNNPALQSFEFRTKRLERLFERTYSRVDVGQLLLSSHAFERKRGIDGRARTKIRDRPLQTVGSPLNRLRIALRGASLQLVEQFRIIVQKKSRDLP